MVRVSFLMLLFVCCWESDGLKRLEGKYPSSDIIGDSDALSPDVILLDAKGETLKGRYAVMFIQKGVTKPETIDEEWPLTIKDIFIGDVPEDRMKANLSFCDELVRIETDNPFAPATHLSNGLKEALGKSQLVWNMNGKDQVMDTKMVWMWGVKNLEENELLPKDLKDEKVYDQDGDGKPGVTIVVEKPLEGERHIVKRVVWLFSKGKVTSDFTKVEGEMSFTVEENALSANPEILKQSSPITPAKDGNKYIWKRINDDITCDQILANLDTIFAN